MSSHMITGHGVRYVDKRMPRMGGKIWSPTGPGIWVLERTACLFSTVAVTSYGSGALSVYDGVPDETGRFPGYDRDDPNSNGTTIFPQPSVQLGSWMLNGWCEHGLTILLSGGTSGVVPAMSFVWVPEQRMTPEAKSRTPHHETVAKGQPVAAMPRGVQDIPRSGSQGTVLRTCQLHTPGVWRVARRDALFYGIEVVHPGAYGRVRVLTGRGEPVFDQPSAFTGSFVLRGGVEDGLLCELASGINRPPLVTISWAEADRATA
jgi:hypothetical protein